jgi:hypothetical protein
MTAIPRVLPKTIARCLLRPRRPAPCRRARLHGTRPPRRRALGFHHTTTNRQHVNAGALWSRYAGGDHTQ